MTRSASAPQQERARRTRENIIEAAARILEHRGYAATKLEDVADAAAVTRGALYFHFKSKASLAEAVVLSHYQRWIVLKAQVEGLDLSALPRILTLTYRVAKASQIEPIIRAGLRMQIEYALIEPELAASLPIPYTGWIEYLTQVICEGERSGEIRNLSEPNELASTIVESFFGIQHVSFRLRNGADLVHRVTRWWNLLLPSIAATDEVTVRTALILRDQEGVRLAAAEPTS